MSRPQHHRGLWARVLAAVVVGTVLGAVAGGLPGWLPQSLLGFIGFSLSFCLPLWWSMLRKDGPATREYCSELDASRGVLDVLVLVASLAALAGVGWILFASNSTGTAKVWEALVAVGAVVGGWLLVHTFYALRYARHWWAAQPGCVDFGTDEPPFSDFLYLATCLGMTFQVADTSFRTPEVRRIALFHTLLSYVWGTVIVASTINLVLGLAQ